jgi:flagellar FliL protein
MATMTEKPVKNEAAEEAAATPPKKKSKKKLIIIMVVLLVVIAGGAKFMLGGSKTSAVATPKPGPLVALDAVTVNLKGGHYLRVGVAVQFTDKVKAAVPPDGAMATDQVIVYFTGQDAATLQTPSALASAKSSLMSKIGKAYPDDPVYDIYFTSFVVQ